MKKLNKKWKNKKCIVTELYSDIQTAKEFGINPLEFSEYHRWDKLILKYFLLIQDYNMNVIMESERKEIDSKINFNPNLPDLKIKGKR